jgi:hypothetical protein
MNDDDDVQTKRPQAFRTCSEDVLRMWTSGAIPAPHIGAVFPAEQANEAFAAMHSRGRAGKVVLRFS